MIDMGTRIIKEIQASVELAGRELSADALDIFASELEQYPEALALEAIRRTRIEVPNRFTVADVVERIRGAHPGPEEAWSIVAPALNDESETVVMTSEMRVAFGAALALAHDKVAARLAFKEKYQSEVSQARAQKRLFPRWYPSLGWDASRRDVVLKDAVASGRLLPATAAPHLGMEVEEVAKLAPQVAVGALIHAKD